MTIDCSDENENASDLIRINRDFDSNEINEKNCQLSKHDEQRISTVDGITKQMIQFRAILNLIQT
jgi:hypothetical protein